MPRPLPCAFFRDWRPDSAYVLGYWFADGNMYRQASAGSYVVSIGSKDLAHLEWLRALIGAGKLTRITGSDVFKLVICRKEAFEDLRRLGGTERKSLTLRWPEVPREHLAHFARGYVDGDGCLSWNKTSAGAQPVLDVVGTYEFVTGLAAAVEAETGIRSPARHRQSDVSNTWRVKWYGMAAKCLSIWLYHYNQGPCLARKLHLAKQFRDWHPRIFFPHRLNARMWELFGDYLP
jgi:hypothetical protein